LQRRRPMSIVALLVLAWAAVVDQAPAAPAAPAGGVICSGRWHVPRALSHLRGGGEGARVRRVLQRRAVKDPARLDATAMLDMLTRGQYSRDLVRLPAPARGFLRAAW